jgi:hypothetical protein
MPDSPRNPTVLWTAAVLVLGTISGCGRSGPETLSVTGTVTLDGKPIAGASVMFMPQFEGQPAVGATDDEGEFTLTTGGSTEGALVGTYQVTVTLKEVSGVLVDKDGLSAGIGPGGIQEKWIVPQRYSTVETSELSVEVARGMEPVRLELTSQ